MSTPNSVSFLISQAIDEQLNKRVSLFQELQTLQSHAKSVADQASTSGVNASAESIGALTTSQTPPDEIRQAEIYVRSEIESVRDIDNKVASAEAEISSIDQLNKNLLIGIAVVVVLLIFLFLSNS